MRTARQDAELSLAETTYAIRSRLPEPLWISLDPIRRMEVGTTTEEKADPLLVCALAAVYGVQVSDLSPKVAEYLGIVDELLNVTASEGGRAQGKSPTKWEPMSADRASVPELV